MTTDTTTIVPVTVPVTEPTAVTDATDATDATDLHGYAAYERVVSNQPVTPERLWDLLHSPQYLIPALVYDLARLCEVFDEVAVAAGVADLSLHPIERKLRLLAALRERVETGALDGGSFGPLREDEDAERMRNGQSLRPRCVLGWLAYAAGLPSLNSMFLSAESPYWRVFTHHFSAEARDAEFQCDDTAQRRMIEEYEVVRMLAAQRVDVLSDSTQMRLSEALLHPQMVKPRGMPYTLAPLMATPRTLDGDAFMVEALASPACARREEVVSAVIELRGRMSALTRALDSYTSMLRAALVAVPTV